MAILIRLAVNGAAMWAAVELVDGMDFDGHWSALVVIAIVMAVVNAVIRPLAKLLSLPLVILTLGLFIFVLNALMLSIVVWVSGVLDLGLTSDGWVPTFIASLVISIVSWILTALFGRDD